MLPPCYALGWHRLHFVGRDGLESRIPANAIISLESVSDPCPAANRPVRAQAFNTVWRQPIRADLRANVPVLVPGNFDP